MINRATLLDAVWGVDHDGGSNIVDVTVRAVRRKLGERATVLDTVRGIGYRVRYP